MAKKKNKLSAWMILPALALVFGLLAGAALVPALAGEDSGIFLNGEKRITLSQGQTYTYVDEGVRFTYFGIDCTDYVEISTNLIKNADGSYTVDTSEEGVYYIAYTSTHPLFESGVRLVRTFVVGGDA